MLEVNFCPRCGAGRSSLIETVEMDDDGKIAVNVLERDFYDGRYERDEIMQPSESATVCELAFVRCGDCDFEFYYDK